MRIALMDSGNVNSASNGVDDGSAKSLLFLPRARCVSLCHFVSFFAHLRVPHDGQRRGLGLVEV